MAAKTNIQSRRVIAMRHKSCQGQATIELALSLPFLIWLIAYTFLAYTSIHSSHVAQRYAAMNVYKRLNNRAQFVMDDVANKLHNKSFMAVQYTEPDGSTLPQRKIMYGPIPVNNIFGVCREPGCQ